MATNTVALNVKANMGNTKAQLDQLGAQLSRLGVGAGGASSKMGGLGNSFKGMIGKASALTAGFIGISSAIRLVSSSITTMANFGMEMSKVKAISGATGEQFSMLEAKARQMGATTMFSATEAAQGLRFLAMAGFDADEAAGSLQATLNLAQASGTDLGKTADIMSNIMKAFALANDQAAEASDNMATIMASSNTDLIQLGDAMKYVGAAATASGISLEDVSAAVGTLSNAGLQASMAGTGLRMIMVKLAMANNTTTETLRKLGLSLEEVNPERVGIRTAMERLRDAGMGTSEAIAIFGARGAAAALSLAAGLDTYDSLREKLDKNEGAAKRMAETMEDNLKGSILMAKSAFQELILSQEGLGSVLSNVVNGFRAYIQLLNGSISSNDKFFQTAQKIKQAMEAIIALVKVFATVWAFNKIHAGILLLSTSITTLKAQIATMTGTVVAGMTAATTATRVFTAAIVATGVGALIVGLGIVLSLAVDWNSEADMLNERLAQHKKHLADIKKEGEEKSKKEIDSERELESAVISRTKKLEELQKKRKVLSGVKEQVNYVVGTSSIGGGGVASRSTIGATAEARSLVEEQGVDTGNMVSGAREAGMKIDQQIASLKEEIAHHQSNEMRNQMLQNKMDTDRATTLNQQLSTVKLIGEEAIRIANTDRQIKDTLTEEEKIQATIKNIKADQATIEKQANSDLNTKNIFDTEEARQKQLNMQIQLEKARVKLADALVKKENELKEAKDKTVKSELAILSAQNNLTVGANLRILKAQAGQTDAMGRPTKAATAAKKELAQVEDAQKQDAFLEKWNASLDKMKGLTPQERANREAEGARIGANVVKAERDAINEKEKKKGIAMGGISSLAAIGGGGGVAQLAEVERQAKVQEKTLDATQQVAMNTRKIMEKMTNPDETGSGSAFQIGLA